MRGQSRPELPPSSAGLRPSRSNERRQRSSRRAEKARLLVVGAGPARPPPPSRVRAGPRPSRSIRTPAGPVRAPAPGARENSRGRMSADLDTNRPGAIAVPLHAVDRAVEDSEQRVGRDRPAQVQRGLGVNPLPLVRGEQLPHRLLVQAIDDPAHGALGVVVPHQHHRLHEVGIVGGPASRSADRERSASPRRTCLRHSWSAPGEPECSTTPGAGWRPRHGRRIPAVPRIDTLEPRCSTLSPAGVLS